MGNVKNTNSGAENGPDSRPSRHPAVRALAAVIALECAGLIAAVVYLVTELFVAPAASLGSAIGIIVVVAIAAVWVGFIAAGVLRGRAWTRAAIVVVQVLIGAVAVGSFQGIGARPEVGVALLVPVVVALALLFSRPVVAATTLRDDTPTY
jgi:hypothetical protein